LEQDANLGVGQAEPPVDRAADLAENLFLGTECGGPEGHPVVEVVDVDDELTESASVGHRWS
jgi:hypothetical protein